MNRRSKTTARRKTINVILIFITSSLGLVATLSYITLTGSIVTIIPSEPEFQPKGVQTLLVIGKDGGLVNYQVWFAMEAMIEDGLLNRFFYFTIIVFLFGASMGYLATRVRNYKRVILEP